MPNQRPTHRPAFQPKPSVAPDTTPTASAALGPTAPVCVGTKVHVNHYHGWVRAVQNMAFRKHPFFPDETEAIPLAHPIYRIELDTTRVRSWVENARQVYIPPDARHLKLFRDEFDVVAEW